MQLPPNTHTNKHTNDLRGDGDGVETIGNEVAGEQERDEGVSGQTTVHLPEVANDIRFEPRPALDLLADCRENFDDIL